MSRICSLIKSGIDHGRVLTYVNMKLEINRNTTLKLELLPIEI